MTDKLEPGWYWVKWFEGDDWQIAERADDAAWWQVGCEFPEEVAPAIIGPRLTPPEGSS